MAGKASPDFATFKYIQTLNPSQAHAALTRSEQR
jgi:hypothetical protein